LLVTKNTKVVIGNGERERERERERVYFGYGVIFGDALISRQVDGSVAAGKNNACAAGYLHSKLVLQLQLAMDTHAYLATATVRRMRSGHRSSSLLFSFLFHMRIASISSSCRHAMGQGMHEAT